MMRHGGMLWGAALYNNGSYPVQEHAVRRVLHARRATRHRQHHAAADAGDDGANRRAADSCDRCSRGRCRSRATSSASSSAVARRPLEIGIPDPDEEPGRPKNRLSNRGLGTLEPHRPGVHRATEDASARPDAQLHGLERRRRRLPQRRLHGVPRRLCQRSVAGALGRSYAKAGNLGESADHRRDDPEGASRAIRSSTS